jgi:hypothetical protein
MQIIRSNIMPKIKVKKPQAKLPGLRRVKNPKAGMNKHLAKHLK